MNSDIEDIKSRLNVADVLKDYIRLEKAGANWRALCPFHNEKTPSFMANEERQFWYCFGCQKSGDIFTFIMEIEGLEFRDALRQLAEKAGVELKKGNPKLAAEKNKTLEILELATKFYEAQLWGEPGRAKILPYLRERGLQDGTIKEFRLGYAPRGWRNLLSFLIKRDYREKEIEKTGLSVKKDAGGHYDRFRDRIIFPIADVGGKITGFSARVAPGGDESQAKYVNTPETEVYHKSKILYGIEKAKAEIRRQDCALLVEGNMDVIAAWQSGIQNTVAVSGTALTPEQIGIIKRYAGKIKIFFDMDAAGESATVKSLKMAFARDVAAEVVELPEGKDAADLARKDPKGLVRAVSASKPAMEYFFGKIFSKYDKNKVDDKKIIAEKLLDMIGCMANTLEKSHWIKKLGAELDTEEAVLTDMLKKATLKERIGHGRPASSEQSFKQRKKEEVLARELAGMFLVYGDVWKRLAEREEHASLFAKDRLLSELAEKGEKAGYNFDNFLKILGSEELVSEAERFFIEKKYRLGLNDSPEEIILDDPLAEAEKLCAELRREIRKSELAKLARDLKTAEENGDRAAAEFLRRQADAITKEIASI